MVINFTHPLGCVSKQSCVFWRLTGHWALCVLCLVWSSHGRIPLRCSEWFPRLGLRLACLWWSCSNQVSCPLLSVRTQNRWGLDNTLTRLTELRQSPRYSDISPSRAKEIWRWLVCFVVVRTLSIRYPQRVNASPISMRPSEQTYSLTFFCLKIKASANGAWEKDGKTVEKIDPMDSLKSIMSLK